VTTTYNYRQIISKAIADEMRADDDVILFGEDVAAAGGAFKTTPGLFEEFGPNRIRDTPISEQAIVGAALGAAMTGLRPVAEVMFADFAGVAFDQIANQVAKYRYMTNGQVRVPLVIRMANGAGSGFGAQHSQSAENWFLNIPGLKIVTPGTVADVYGLLRASIRDDNPVLFFEHKNLFAIKGEVARVESEIVPLGQAAVVREGVDITVVASQLMRHRAMEAAEALAAEGISLEVIDPRTIVPFDDATVLESLRRTSRLMVVQEGPRDGSWGSSLVSRIVTENFETLDAPPVVLSSENTPVPYASNLEDLWLTSVAEIVDAARLQVRY
jgi:pyruvate dehydrogenase E1 component beta subunit